MLDTTTAFYSVYSARSGKRLGGVIKAFYPSLAIIAVYAAPEPEGLGCGPLDVTVEKLPKSCFGAGAEQIVYSGAPEALEAAEKEARESGRFDHERHGLVFEGFFRFARPVPEISHGAKARRV